MKTLREFELEQKIQQLEFELRRYRGDSMTIGRYDDIDYSQSIQVNAGHGDLPMVARVSAIFGYSRLSVVLESVGSKDAFRHAYYIDHKCIPDKYHLEQALVGMHEKVIHQIVRERMKES